ncbi:MAG: hypothetical protein U0X20_23625 [Caldilineaceae bacterium]
MIHVPRSALRYVSYELREALEKLSEQQQKLIAASIFRDKATGKTLIPYRYIGTGPGKMVSEHTYYARDGGWAHQPEFVEAVRLAKARVLEVDLEEDLCSLAEVRRRARAKLPAVVDRWDAIMSDGEAPARDRIEAGSRLVEFATDGLAQGGEGAGLGAGGSEEADWWRAAQQT